MIAICSPACWPGTTINKYGNSRRENSSIEPSIRFESNRCFVKKEKRENAFKNMLKKLHYCD